MRGINEAETFERFLNSIMARDFPLFFEDHETKLVYYIDDEKAYLIKEEDWQDFKNNIFNKLLNQ